MKNNEIIGIVSLYNVEFEKDILNNWYSNFMIVENQYIIDNYCNNDLTNELKREFTESTNILCIKDNIKPKYALIYKPKIDINIDENFYKIDDTIKQVFELLQNCAFIYTKHEIFFGLCCIIYKNIYSIYNLNANRDLLLFNIHINDNLFLINNELIPIKNGIILNYIKNNYFHKFKKSDLKCIYKNFRKYEKIIYYNKMNICLDFYTQSKQGINFYNRLIHLSICLESVLCNNLSFIEKSNITKTLEERGSKICGLNDKEQNIFNIFYSLRSSIVHNGNCKKDNTLNKVKTFLNIDKTDDSNEMLLLFVFLHKFNEHTKKVIIFYIEKFISYQNSLKLNEYKKINIKDINNKFFEKDKNEQIEEYKNMIEKCKKNIDICTKKIKLEK